MWLLRGKYSIIHPRVFNRCACKAKYINNKSCQALCGVCAAQLFQPTATVATCLVSLQFAHKLDGVGPGDNRPSTD